MARGKKVKMGRPSVYTLVKPRFNKIINWIGHKGMTLDGVARKLGISRSALFKLRNEHEEFRRVLECAHAVQEDTLVGKLWQLAMGEAVRTTTTTYKKGEDGEYTIAKTIQFEQNLNAILALLKRYHGWGMIEKSAIKPIVMSPVLDDSEARRRIAILLGIEKPPQDDKQLVDTQALEIVDA